MANVSARIDDGCYICEPEKHEHDDPECMGCDQGCLDCFNDFIEWAEGTGASKVVAE